MRLWRIADVVAESVRSLPVRFKEEMPVAFEPHSVGHRDARPRQPGVTFRRATGFGVNHHMMHGDNRTTLDAPALPDIELAPQMPVIDEPLVMPPDFLSFIFAPSSLL